MITPLEMGAFMTAGIGGITAFWSQLQGFTSRLRSLVFVTVDLHGHAGDNYLSYCFANYKALSLATKRYIANDNYVIPNKRYERVAFEVSGQVMTFFKGRYPIFVSVKKDAGGGFMDSNLTVSFFRGTIDFPTELMKAVELFNSRSHNKNENKSRRFMVNKFFGRSASMGNNQNHTEQDSGGATPSSISSDHLAGKIPLGITLDDIGAPSSKDPFGTLQYGPGILEFKEEIKRWMNSKEWFESKKIPHRFGAGLYGPPGTGKSSFIRATGQEFDLPIDIYDLTTMDNEELVKFWGYSLNKSPCMVVFEDIDRIFDKDKNVRTATNKSPLTLDCLLNCINGVQPADGILVMVTANDVSKVDPALGVPDETGRSTRPGRLDRTVYFGALDEAGRQAVAERILSDTPELIEQTVKAGIDESGAQFESRCAKLALERYWSDKSIGGTDAPVVLPRKMTLKKASLTGSKY